jgi:hypothetical protein
LPLPSIGHFTDATVASIHRLSTKGLCKRQALRRFNEATRSDEDLDSSYRSPENHRDHDGLLWYAAHVIKHKLSARELPAAGIINIEESEYNKEGHIELLIILQRSIREFSAAEQLNDVLNKFGMR